MKKKNFNKKLNLNKSIVANLSSISMLKINGGSENLETQETAFEACANPIETVRTGCSGAETQAASTMLMTRTKI